MDNGQNFQKMIRLSGEEASNPRYCLSEVRTMTRVHMPQESPGCVARDLQIT